MPQHGGTFGPHPQYGWDFPEEIPEEFRKDPGSVWFPFLEGPFGNFRKQGAQKVPLTTDYNPATPP